MTLILPRTPGGIAAAQEMDRRREQAAADNIAASSKTALSSDEFLTPDDVKDQVHRLIDYIASGARLPQPVGWRIAFLILQPPERTAGGLELPSDVTEEYAYKSMQGICLDMGMGAYTDKERFPVGPWVKTGDRLVFKRYDAQLYDLANGQTIGLMNDTQPIAVIDDGWWGYPEGPNHE